MNKKELLKTLDKFGAMAGEIKADLTKTPEDKILAKLDELIEAVKQPCPYPHYNYPYQWTWSSPSIVTVDGIQGNCNSSGTYNNSNIGSNGLRVTYT
jgi:hypothetical protein